LQTSVEAYTTPAATLCNSEAKNCCKAAQVGVKVTDSVALLKTALTTFTGGLAKVGAAITKLANTFTTANEADTGTKLDAAVAAAAADNKMGGATKAQGIVFLKYATTYQADFDKFKAAVPDCWGKWTSLIQRAYCYGCSDNTNPAAFFKAATTGPVFPLKQAECNTIAEKCAQVWGFMHRITWMMQVAANLNKQKGGATVPTVPAVPGSTTGYYGSVTLTEAVAAVDGCFADPTLATACTEPFKANLCKAFINLWTATPRGTADNMVDGAFDKLTRRVLLAGDIATGDVMIDATNGIDTTAVPLTTIFPPTAAADLTAPATTAWVSGYTAPTTNTTTNTSTNTTTSTTAKNAKVLIGTLLTAILSIALLN